MNPIKTYYKNRLPHKLPVGGTFFITFRLADSLPQHIIQKHKEELDQITTKLEEEKPEGYKDLIYKAQKLYFGKYDHQLDEKPYGECYLNQPEIIRIIKDCIHKYDGKWYDLHAYCIMPNHVHLLIDTAIQLEDTEQAYTQVDVIMKHIKGRSARFANQFLGRRGTFWQKESYDHYVREHVEWQRIITYILHNPSKAGLIDDWNKWEGNYLKEGLGIF